MFAFFYALFTDVFIVIAEKPFAADSAVNSFVINSRKKQLNKYIL